MMTGICLVVFFSYSAKPGLAALCASQIWSRSAPRATRARSFTVVVPISASTLGWASRLWYQSGLVGAPLLEAKTAYPPGTGRYIIGFTRGCPVLAPTVCRSSSGAPSNWPPTLPPLARNSSMILLFQSVISGVSAPALYLLDRSCRPARGPGRSPHGRALHPNRRGARVHSLRPEWEGHALPVAMNPSVLVARLVQC